MPKKDFSDFQKRRMQQILIEYSKGPHNDDTWKELTICVGTLLDTTDIDIVEDFLAQFLAP